MKHLSLQSGSLGILVPKFLAGGVPGLTQEPDSLRINQGLSQSESASQYPGCSDWCLCGHVTPSCPIRDDSGVFGETIGKINSCLSSIFKSGRRGFRPLA